MERVRVEGPAREAQLFSPAAVLRARVNAEPTARVPFRPMEAAQ